MRILIRLVQLVILVALILVIGRTAPLPKSLQWFLITALIWVAFWEEIARRFTEWLAKRVFDTSIDWHWKPNGKWYAYSRGFIHLTKDGINLGRDSCLLTLFYWVMTISILIIGMVVVIPKIALWLQ